MIERQFDLPLDPHGTAFQLQVWGELRKIPFGVTMTYGELAYTLGKPTASRAVGGANHRNPLPIVVPCHRVIGADGRLTGFASGLEIKQHLLDLERCRDRWGPATGLLADGYDLKSREPGHWEAAIVSDLSCQQNLIRSL